MDPTATLIDLLNAINCNDRDSALDAVAALGNWLAGGGFLPDLAALGVREQIDAAARIAS